MLGDGASFLAKTAHLSSTTGARCFWMASRRRKRERRRATATTRVRLFPQEKRTQAAENACLTTVRFEVSFIFLPNIPVGLVTSSILKGSLLAFHFA